MRALLFVCLVSCHLEWGPEAPCATADKGAEVTVYTSAYPPVVAALRTLASQRGLQVSFFQAGSEKLAARLDTELAAGQTSADLLLASDPLYYIALKRRRALAPYASLRALKLDHQWVDPDGAFVTARISLMGIAYVPKRLPAPPRAFVDLPPFHPTLPDALGSGTMMTTAIAWHARYGAAFFTELRHKGATASGGGTAVVDRLQRGEADLGVALLENVLLAPGGGVAFVLPSDGGVIVPGQLALLAQSHHPEQAKRVYDFLLSPEAQAVFTAQALYSPFTDIAPPEGAPPLPTAPSAERYEQWADAQASVRAAWSSAWQ